MSAIYLLQMNSSFHREHNKIPENSNCCRADLQVSLKKPCEMRTTESRDTGWAWHPGWGTLCAIAHE